MPFTKLGTVIYENVVMTSQTDQGLEDVHYARTRVSESEEDGLGGPWRRAHQAYPAEGDSGGSLPDVTRAEYFGFTIQYLIILERRMKQHGEETLPDVGTSFRAAWSQGHPRCTAIRSPLLQTGTLSCEGLSLSKASHYILFSSSTSLHRLLGRK